MSLKIEATIICDTCPATRSAEPEHRLTWVSHMLWELKRDAEKDGWTTINRGMGHTQTHYCPKCIDKPMKPVPRKKRKKR